MHVLSLFIWGIKGPVFQMTVKIQNNKGYNILMQSVNDIRKQDRDVMDKGSTERKFMKKQSVFLKRMAAIQTNIFPPKEPITREINMKTFLSLVIVLYSKENSFMWCKGYFYKQIPMIYTLLFNITGRSCIINIQMKLMCWPTSKTYSRIKLQLPYL